MIAKTSVVQVFLIVFRAVLLLRGLKLLGAHVLILLGGGRYAVTYSVFLAYA